MKNLGLDEDHDEGLLHSLEPFTSAEGKVVMDSKKRIISIPTPADPVIFLDDFGASIASAFCFGDQKEVRWLPYDNVVLTPFGRKKASPLAAGTDTTRWIPRFSRVGFRKPTALFLPLSFLVDIRKLPSRVDLYILGMVWTKLKLIS